MTFGRLAGELERSVGTAVGAGVLVDVAVLVDVPVLAGAGVLVDVAVFVGVGESDGIDDPFAGVEGEHVA
jgi:hypothetical protein